MAIYNKILLVSTDTDHINNWMESTEREDKVLYCASSVLGGFRIYRREHPDLVMINHIEFPRLKQLIERFEERHGLVNRTPIGGFVPGGYMHYQSRSQVIRNHEETDAEELH